MTAFLALVLAFAPPQTSPDALSDAAKQLATEQNHETAAVLWKRALAINPNHFPSLFNFGFMRYSLKQYSDAEPLLARAAKVNPGDFNTRYILGATLAASRKREAALLEWRVALRLQPDNVKLMQIMAVEYGKGAYFKEACELARRALDVNKFDLAANLVAIKTCQDARDPEVIEIARRAVEYFPGSAQTNFEYAFQLQKLGHREESVPYLEKAMTLDRAYEEPFFFLGDLLLKDERYEEAVGHLRTALRIKPDYVPACVSLAKALMGLDQLPHAVGALEACAQRNPRHPSPHLLLSQVYFRMGDEKRATEEKELSLRLRRENPDLMESPQARPFPVAMGR